MNYELSFHEAALKEWQKLEASLKAQFKKQLAKRLKNPHVPSSAKLRGRDMKNVYKLDIGFNAKVLTVQFFTLSKSTCRFCFVRARSQRVVSSLGGWFRPKNLERYPIFRVQFMLASLFFSSAF